MIALDNELDRMSSSNKAKSFFPSARLTRKELGGVMLYRKASNHIALQSKELLALWSMKKEGFNVSQCHMDRSHQKAIHKPNNFFAQQHHKAKSLVCCSLIVTGLGNINLFEVSEDGCYFATAVSKTASDVDDEGQQVL